MLSNATLSVAIESLNGIESNNYSTDEKELQNKQHIYFSFILWTTFGLSAVRFTGVCILVYVWSESNLLDRN